MGCGSDKYRESKDSSPKLNAELISQIDLNSSCNVQKIRVESDTFCLFYYGGRMSVQKLSR